MAVALTMLLWKIRKESIPTKLVFLSRVIVNLNQSNKQLTVAAQIKTRFNIKLTVDESTFNFLTRNLIMTLNYNHAEGNSMNALTNEVTQARRGSSSYQLTLSKALASAPCSNNSLATDSCPYQQAR